jgi:hypothetical protein
MHTLRILNHKGDTAVEWRPEIEDEVERARLTFDALMASGHLMFTVVPGTAPEQVRSFDPSAFEVIAVPRYVGG